MGLTPRTPVGHRVRPNNRHLKFCMAMGATLLLAGAVAFTMRHVRTLKVDETSVITEREIKNAVPLKAFKQCGGVAWEGATCCMKGCACVKESKYYSGCQAALSKGHCDPDSVEDEAVAAKQRLKQAKEDVKVAEAKAKEAEDWLADSLK